MLHNLRPHVILSGRDWARWWGNCEQVPPVLRAEIERESARLASKMSRNGGQRPLATERNSPRTTATQRNKFHWMVSFAHQDRLRNRNAERSFKALG
ncbi:hypothetical protein QTI24_31040 [Variovorax sp. J22P240]|uniref:hypothetical protein n=1 Tax=Variovorax sp. J22P240 TaxID=3053514 RepID=UPI002578CB5A|nr:hypothetical protein [Variovorax sp. J22P240]MDM0003053.1 hypothetical protein [Variovorax sp. J22P240]